MLKTLINNDFIKKKNIVFFNKKNLFFFKFLKLKNIKKKKMISLIKIMSTKLVKHFIDRLSWKKKRYKRYNYFKFSMVKYMRYISNVNIYKINNFLINYKFTFFINKIHYNQFNDSVYLSTPTIVKRGLSFNLLLKKKKVWNVINLENENLK